MLTTTNYKFKKRELTDSPPDITTTNSNWDTVDALFRELSDARDTWETFKTGGGVIGGPMKGTPGTTGHRFLEHTGVFNSRNALLRMSTANMSGYPALINLIEDLDNSNNNNGFLFVLGNGKSGDAYKDSFLRPVYSAYGAGSVNLGSPSVPWDDIYLSGSSKATNGYTKLPNGLILQWGINDITVPKGGANAALFSLPISFTQNYGLFGIAQASLNVSGGNAAYTDAITCVCTVTDKSQVRIGVSDNGNKLPSSLTFRINWVVMSY